MHTFIGGTGIVLWDNAVSNYIIQNAIYSNNYSGIMVSDAGNNFILSNAIYGRNQDYGIHFISGSCDNTYIKYNQIYKYLFDIRNHLI